MASECPHIFIDHKGRSISFTPPKRKYPTPDLPDRNRGVHGRHLVTALREIKQRTEALDAERKSNGVSTEFGVILEFESEPGFSLTLTGLDRRQSGIELLNVRDNGATDEDARVEFATVYVPFGKIAMLQGLAENYLTKETRFEKPQNMNLIDSISNIRIAAIKAFWTSEKPFPKKGEAVFWEAWLRTGTKGARGAIEEAFLVACRAAGVEVFESRIKLPESTIRLIRAKPEQIEASIDILNCLTDLRPPCLTSAFFSRMSQVEQAEWVDDLMKRTTLPDAGANAVCLLDTGVNFEHPLLAGVLAPEDAHTYDPSWGSTDTHHPHGHGTQMAGLAAYGDLKDALESPTGVHLAHRLESVKIFHHRVATPPDLYGAVSREATGRVELQAPRRRRVFSLQITSTDGRERGMPSSWSTEMDQLASAANEEAGKRLYVISAGNVHMTDSKDYPALNHTEQIHDPAQSWNSITVGAYTERVDLDASTHRDWKPLASEGSLCPTSSTTIDWHDAWPIKPDVVMEGGNFAINPADGSADHTDSLQLLTTNAKFRDSLLTTTGDTSAAAAQLARYAAIIQGSDARLWPETVRALIVHSAHWHPSMLGNRRPDQLSRHELKTALRQYGFGVPNLAEALSSVRNSVTLVCQDEIQPFILDDGNAYLNKLKEHSFPWPKEELARLLDAPAEMRVTLSYFIEPNPRAGRDRYRYQSCGLRFDVKRPAEPIKTFRARINGEIERDENYLAPESDSTDWLLGAHLRSKGSIHSDIWKGTAAELAEKDFLAVFPVTGWWKTRKQLGKANNSLRYSLIVSIRLPETDVDIYTPIANAIRPKITISM